MDGFKPLTTILISLCAPRVVPITSGTTGACGFEVPEILFGYSSMRALMFPPLPMSCHTSEAVGGASHNSYEYTPHLMSTALAGVALIVTLVSVIDPLTAPG